MARPTDYNTEIASIILARISAGESVNKICSDDTMPCASSVYRWLSLSPEFSEKYKIAQDDRASFMFEQMLDIADGSSEDVQRDRLRVDTRKWALSRMSPRKYGDKLALGGDEDGAPILVTWASEAK